MILPCLWKTRNRNSIAIFSSVWSGSGDATAYRAGDGVHAAWLERRARYEPKWRTLLRQLNLKHEQILRLEESLYGPKSTSHLIANAAFVKQEITDTYGTDAERIAVIPNGFDAPALEPETREVYRPPSDPGPSAGRVRKG